VAIRAEEILDYELRDKSLIRSPLRLSQTHLLQDSPSERLSLDSDFQFESLTVGFGPNPRGIDEFDFVETLHSL
jgi:hypothetical protein